MTAEPALTFAPFGSGDLLSLKSVRAALARLDRFVLSGRKATARRIMLLVGPPSSGKTRLIEEICQGYPPEREETPAFRRTRHPIVHVDLPSPCNPRSLCCAIFREFGLRRGTVNVVAETARFLKAIGVEVLVLDEGDHLLASQEERQTVQFIVGLVKQGICQVILCGSPKLKKLFARTRTGGNAPITYSLPPLKDEEGCEAICELQRTFPCETSLCSNQDFIFRILAAAEGRLGALARLWRVASIHAAVKGHPSINFVDFALAWQDRGGSGENPFGDLAGSLGPDETILVRQNPCQELDFHASGFRRRRSQLPIRLRPFRDESLIGFLMRLGDANCLSHLREVADVNIVSQGGLPLMHLLARLADLPLIELQRIAYVPDEERGVVSFMGRALPMGELSDRRCLCPLCLAESPYHRAIWDLYELDVCPTHGVRLIANCPVCRQSLRFGPIPLTKCLKRGLPVWPDVRQLPCRCDFAECESRPASPREMKAGRSLLRRVARLPAF